MGCVRGQSMKTKKTNKKEDRDMYKQKGGKEIL
jgi:hypothetical protein